MQSLPTATLSSPNMICDLRVRAGCYSLATPASKFDSVDSEKAMSYRPWIIMYTHVVLSDWTIARTKFRVMMTYCKLRVHSRYTRAVNTGSVDRAPVNKTREYG